MYGFRQQWHLRHRRREHQWNGELVQGPVCCCCFRPIKHITEADRLGNYPDLIPDEHTGDPYMLSGLAHRTCLQEERNWRRTYRQETDLPVRMRNRRKRWTTT